MSNPIIGADYAMCQKCGGWVAFCSVHANQSVIVHEMRHDKCKTWGDRSADFATKWESKGFKVERYGLGDNVPACDCPKELDDVILGGGFAQ